MKKTEKVFNAFDKVYRGCGWLLVNFFVLGFLCWALYAGFVGFRVETNGEIAEGHVSHLEPRDGGAYRAVFEFEVNGQTYSFNDDTSARPPKYELGEAVTVRYDRTNPNIAQVDDSPFPLWLFPSCTIVGLLIALIVVNIWGWRAWKRGEEIIDLP
ncbi:MAG: DUF3592 domain-containing protein [Anaerolineales bacterium]|nr:DUF3592 domain-containing protein [Anaerolineales bacterium]